MDLMSSAQLCMTDVIVVSHPAGDTSEDRRTMSPVHERMECTPFNVFCGKGSLVLWMHLRPFACTFGRCMNLRIDAGPLAGGRANLHSCQWKGVLEDDGEAQWSGRVSQQLKTPRSGQCAARVTHTHACMHACMHAYKKNARHAMSATWCTGHGERGGCEELVRCV